MRWFYTTTVKARRIETKKTFHQHDQIYQMQYHIFPLISTLYLYNLLVVYNSMGKLNISNNMKFDNNP